MAIAVIIPVAAATNYITEGYLVEEYAKNFPDTDVTREDKIAVMNNILNTKPIEIPTNEKRDQLMQIVTELIETRNSLTGDLAAQKEIDKQIEGLKMDMAKSGLTMPEDYNARNGWYDLAHQYSSQNAHEIPEREQKFNVIPKADASEVL